MKFKVINLLLIIFCFLTTSINAQKNVETQNLLWLRYNLKLNINTNYQIRQELEERTFWFPWRQHQFASRTLLDRRLGNGWNTAIGFTYLEQALPQNPTIKNFKNTTELRPQIEIAYNQIVSSQLSLNHRYWTDFRFFEQTDGSFDYSNIRTRYKLELSYKPTNRITLRTFDEIQINVGSKIVNNIFDQNRYGGSIQYMPKENFGFELEYLNSFQQHPSGVDFYNRNIIRLTFHQTLNLKNSKS